MTFYSLTTLTVWLELGRRMLYIPLAVAPDRRISAQSLKRRGSSFGVLVISAETGREVFTDDILMGLFAHKSRPPYESALVMLSSGISLLCLQCIRTWCVRLEYTSVESLSTEIDPSFCLKDMLLLHRGNSQNCNEYV